jgi:hypothetical protein
MPKKPNTIDEYLAVLSVEQRDELEGYDKANSALHFTADKPLPAALVRKLLRARAAEGKR